MQLCVCVRACVRASVLLEAIRWSWCLTEGKGERQGRQLYAHCPSTCYHKISVSNIVLHTELLVSLSINYLWYSVGCEFTLGRIVQGVKITP